MGRGRGAVGAVTPAVEAEDDVIMPSEWEPGKAGPSVMGVAPRDYLSKVKLQQIGGVRDGKGSNAFNTGRL